MTNRDYVERLARIQRLEKLVAVGMVKRGGFFAAALPWVAAALLPYAPQALSWANRQLRKSFGLDQPQQQAQPQPRQPARRPVQQQPQQAATTAQTADGQATDATTALSQMSPQQLMQMAGMMHGMLYPQAHGGAVYGQPPWPTAPAHVYAAPMPYQHTPHYMPQQMPTYSPDVYAPPPPNIGGTSQGPLRPTAGVPPQVPQSGVGRLYGPGPSPFAPAFGQS